ncbi:MAG: twin-arginine translocase TatA/TatE family subunit [Saprospiraceae bacterium]|nr:twin-arginine translocase TatA/TatE family subunit [Saprospiraceae bacterium]
MIPLLGLGIMEIGILVLAVLFLFGGNKMKGLAREIVQGYGKVKDVRDSVEKEIKDTITTIDITKEDK